jgi:integrase
MASIKKQPSGRWKVKYWTPDGRGQRTKTFDRKIDAERFAKTVEADKLRGTWVDPRHGQMLFKELAERWLPSTGHLRPGTRDNINSRLRNHVLPYFGDMPIGRIRPHHVREWVAGLSAAGLAPGTVKSVHGLFARILKMAEIDGLIVRTPVVAIMLPKEVSREEMIFLSPKQITALAEAIAPRYSTLVYTAAYTGMRIGELAALRVERVNVLRGVVDVVESLSEVNGHLHIGPTKTGARRSISLPRFLAHMLGQHIGCFSSPEGFVFASTEGLPLRRRNFYQRHYKPAVRKAGLDERLRFHDLRHTCAALLIAQGAHPKEIQERLGHSTIRLTFDRYGHLFPSLDDRLRDGLQGMYERARDLSVTRSDEEDDGDHPEGKEKAL